MHLYTAIPHRWKIPHKTVLNMICLLFTLSVFANAPEIRAETLDLVVDSVRVNRATLNPGDTFRLDTVIRNQGKVASGETTVRYYLSSDEIISSEDTEIGTSTLRSVRIGGTTEPRMQFTAPDTPGTYYYGICIDSAANESDATNNCSVGTAITAKGADLMIFDTPQISKTEVKAGETFQIETRVWNKGRVASSETTLRYYLSPDENLSLEDIQVATDSVPALSGRGAHASRRRVDITNTLTAPDTPGTHYYVVCVDAVAGDADTINNCSQAIAITVEAPVPDPTASQVSTPMTRPQYPDLVISSARVDASTIMLGGGVRVYITIENRGMRAAEAITIRYYRSLDATISPEDTELRAVNVGRLDAGKSTTTWTLLPSPTSLGVYYYGACIDGVASESDTSNNCSSAIKVTVELQGSDQKLLLPVGIIPAQYLKVGGSSVVLDVSGNFVGQVERWRANFSGTGAVAVRLVGSTLTLAPVSKGWWVVTIEARSGNLIAKQTFSVSVSDADTPEPEGDTVLDLSPEVSIPDANLRAVVRTALELGEDDTLTQLKMHSLTRVSAPNLEIKNLTGLEHAIRLIELDVPQNQISDITPLTNLTTLSRIVLNENYISNITPLTWLTRLTEVSLAQNRISNINPLTNLIGLSELRLQKNQISNINALTELTRLTALSLSENQIRNITPLENLTTLTELHLQKNQIINVAPLADLTDLTTLTLIDNPISDYAPLRRLKAENSGISIDIDITEDPDNVQTAPSAPAFPAETALLPNYPNPFNPETWIPYRLSQAADVSLTIYDISGRVVRQLALGYQPAGFYQSRARAAYWDGRNALGEKVATGIYFYTFTAGEFTATGKMLIQK